MTDLIRREAPFRNSYPSEEEQELQEKLRKLEEINAELKINENEHEMLGDEKEEKQDKFPDKNSPERC